MSSVTSMKVLNDHYPVNQNTSLTNHWHKMVIMHEVKHNTGPSLFAFTKGRDRDSSSQNVSKSFDTNGNS